MPVDATVTRFPVNGSEARALVESNGRLGASCVRAAGDADAGALPAESRRVAELAPTLRGYSEFWDIVAGCVGWPTPSRWQPHRWRVPASFPASLLLSGAHDVATPRVWAVSVQRSLPGSRIVRWDGDGHAGWPMHDRDAVEAAGRYLVAGPASR